MVFRFIARLVRGVLKAGVCLAGLVAVAAVWDYTQQAKEVDYAYSFADYPPSVLARYGDEIDRLADAADVVTAGVMSGLQNAADSELVGQLGLDWTALFGQPAPAAMPAPEPVQIATLQTGSAPETSLFPQARVTR